MAGTKKIEFLSQIRAMETDILTDKLRESKLRVAKLASAHAVSSMENPMLIRELRRDIARIQTVLHARILNAKKADTATTK